MYFEIAVTGALAGNRLGVVRQCIDCRSNAGPHAPPCPGFGPGCLAPTASPPRREPPKE